jgi:inhibitor of KinA sporulation pathway (predicted exonuclease)
MVKIFMDLEMNPISKNFNIDRNLCRSEVIQIGAVAVNTNDHIIGEYEQMVKPHFSIAVTPKVYRLTGITSDMVHNGLSFEEAMNDFSKWCDKISGHNPYEIYAWSDNDLIQLQQEMLVKELTYFFDMQFMNVWTDFQYIFCDLLGINAVLSLDKAVQALDMNFTGNQHSALSDAMNTAKIYLMVQNKEAFEKVMQPIKEMMEPSAPIGTQLGSIFNLEMFDFNDN